MRDDFLTLKDLSALAMALGAGLPSISKRSQLGVAAEGRRETRK
jgi:hypothetical protein